LLLKQSGRAYCFRQTVERSAPPTSSYLALPEGAGRDELGQGGVHVVHLHAGPGRDRAGLEGTHCRLVGKVGDHTEGDFERPPVDATDQVVSHRGDVAAHRSYWSSVSGCWQMR
jgi:hypothetical protein